METRGNFSCFQERLSAQQSKLPLTIFENSHYGMCLRMAYRQSHGTDTAIHSLKEQPKKELENHNIIGLVSVDLSKAFDTVMVLCISNI